MWIRTNDRFKPAFNEQVVGLLGEDVDFWTLTEEGWYCSAMKGLRGSKVDMVPAYWSPLPNSWMNQPKPDEDEEE